MLSDARLCLAATLVAGTAFSAQADLSDLLDRIPAGVPAIAVVPDSGSLISGAQAFLNQINQGQAALGLGMASGMLNTPGLGSGAIVAVVTKPFNPQLGEEPDPVILIEFDDLDQAVESFGGQNAGGIIELNLFGEIVYIRDLGDDVGLLSPSREIAAGFEAAEGMAGQHQKKLGLIGGEVLDSNHIVIAGNFDVFAEGALEMVELGKQQAMGMAAMLGPGGAVLQDESIGAAITAFFQQADAGMLGLRFTPEAVAIDLATNFKPGTEIAGFFADTGSTDGLLSRVPNSPFLYAHAFDNRSEGLSKLRENAEAFSANLNAAIGQGGNNNLPDLFETGKTGEAFVVGQTPGGLLGGLLSRSTRYVRTDDPAGALADAGQIARGMQEADIGGPFLLTGSWQPDAAEAEGTSAARWSIGVRPKPGDPSAQQIMPGLSMMFGPTAGPAGFAAATQGGVVQTLSAGNTALLTDALIAARDNNGLSTGDRLGIASTMLPENRFAEIYINGGTILQSVRGLLGIFLQGVNLDIPNELTPIGASMSAGGGGFSTRIILPSDVIVFGMETAEALDNQGVKPIPGEFEDAPPGF